MLDRLSLRADPSATFTHRLRSLLEPGDAPLPRPRPARLEPARRSALAAAWQARAAVRAGLPLDDFLRARLAGYRAKLPVPSARLPLSIAIEDGDVAARAAPAPSPDLPDPSDAAGPLAAEGLAARHEATDLEVRMAILDGEIEAARRRGDELAHRFAADVGAGLVASPPGLDATAEQMGRPAVRGGGVRNALVALAVSALGAEAWQIAVPLLAGAGVDPAALAAEAHARPGDVASLVLFALGVTAALLLLADAALSAGAALLAGEADPGRRRWLAAAGSASGVLAALVTLSVAALPRTGARTPAGAPLAVLLLAVPAGAALVLRVAARLAAARDEELSRALAWDRERALSLADRGRRLEELRWAEDEETSLERRREAARRRLRDLNARVAAAARRAAAAAERERAGLARLAQALVAALELDRYAWLRCAAARGGAARSVSPRRPADARPEPMIAAPPPRAPAVEVEAGRLAS